MSSDADPEGVGDSLTAPAEGRASTCREIANELASALVAFDHIDYNAVTVDELSELLEARETVEELCLRYRDQQSTSQEAGDSRA